MYPLWWFFISFLTIYCIVQYINKKKEEEEEEERRMVDEVTVKWLGDEWELESKAAPINLRYQEMY